MLVLTCNHVLNVNVCDMQAPRRDCCRVLSTEKKSTVVIDVGECREGESIQPQY